MINKKTKQNGQMDIFKIKNGGGKMCKKRKLAESRWGTRSQEASLDDSKHLNDLPLKSLMNGQKILKSFLPHMWIQRAFFSFIFEN